MQYVLSLGPTFRSGLRNSSTIVMREKVNTLWMMVRAPSASMMAAEEFVTRCKRRDREGQSIGQGPGSGGVHIFVLTRKQNQATLSKNTLVLETAGEEKRSA